MGLRDDVLAAAMALSVSNSYLDRADAAWVLALFVGTDEVDDRLIQLACDLEDTWVTEAAIDALLRREDVAGWALIARAYAVDPDDHAQAHMVDAIERFLSWRDPDEAAQDLREAVQDESPQVQAGASALLKAVVMFRQANAERLNRTAEKPPFWRRKGH